MELHKAIKEIISLKGKDIIANAQIINFLLDYQAFKDFPAAKMVLRDIIGMGYSEKILSLDSNNQGWRTKWSQYIHEFTESYGYKEDLVFYVFNSIVFGVGITPNLMLQEQSSTESEESTNGNEALVGKIAGLKLPSGNVSPYIKEKALMLPELDCVKQFWSWDSECIQWMIDHHMISELKTVTVKGDPLLKEPEKTWFGHEILIRDRNEIKRIINE